MPKPEQLIHQIPSTAKNVGDLTGIGTVITAFIDIIHPMLETGILILTAVWFYYRIKESIINIKEKENRGSKID